MAKDPALVSKKWADNLSASTPSIRAGVQGVTEAPGVAAARAKQLWLQRITASQDKWAQRVSSVSLSDWQQATLGKGLDRIATGAQAAIPKQTAFFQDFLPFIEQGAQTVRAMPKGNVEQGIARAAAMIRYTSGYKRK
jgi:hypothetical protein